MEEIRAIAVCGSCHALFNGTDMVNPCPKCGKEITFAAADQTDIVNMIFDGQALWAMHDYGCGIDTALDELYEDSGLQWFPDKTGADRFVRDKDW